MTSTDTPAGRVLIDHDEVPDTVATAAEVLRERCTEPWAEALAELLDQLADDMGDERVVEIEHPDRPECYRTAAWKLAQAVLKLGES